MREFFDLRLSEEKAKRFLLPSVGKIFSVTRKLELTPDDPLFEHIGQIDKELRDNGDEGLLWFWTSHRKYTQKEIAQAELFHLRIDVLRSEVDGVTYGTIYDESATCRHCGVGRQQLSNLILDLAKLPKNKEIARTIANEWLVSDRLAKLIKSQGVTGVDLLPVKHARTSKKPLAKWYQLIVNGRSVPMLPSMRFGINPFNEDASGQYRCPLGHVAGLNVLSEIFVSRQDWDGLDLTNTTQSVGYRPKEGLFVPTPLLVISPKFYQLLKIGKIRGYTAEIAHLT